MKRTRFGATALRVTRMGLGLAALGRPGYINLGHGEDLRNKTAEPVMRDHAWDVLDAAYRKGIRYFDVARSYGKAEEFLSGWSTYQGDHDMVIGSKWGYTYTADWKVQADKHEIKEHSLSNLKRQWPESYRWIGKRLGIYHIHSATPDSGALDNPELLDELWRLKRTGIVVGLSLSGPGQAETLEKATRIRKDGELLFGSVQATWNALEQSATEALVEASRMGMGVIIKEALANGRLTDRNTHSEFEENRKILNRLSEKYKVGADALCIAFVSRQPWVNIVLSGASTIQQLESNLMADNLAIDPEDMEQLGSLRISPVDYWRERAELEWN